MTRIDFYTGATDKLRTACQLSHKAMQAGLRTVISTQDAATADTLDTLLWSFPPTAFIPHCRSDTEGASATPVVLNHVGNHFPHHELMISLHDECVSFFSRFDRVIEIVGTDEEDSRRGRERYKFYKDRGYELHHFDLQTQKG